MFKTKLPTVLKGASLWAIALMFPLVLWYVKSGEFKTLVFLVYPIILSLLSRSGLFWIRSNFIAFSSVITFLFALILRQNRRVAKSLENTEDNKEVSAVVLTSVSIVFLLSIIMMGLFVDSLYDSGEFI